MTWYYIGKWYLNFYISRTIFRKKLTKWKEFAFDAFFPLGLNWIKVIFMLLQIQMHIKKRKDLEFKYFLLFKCVFWVYDLIDFIAKMMEIWTKLKKLNEID